MTHHWAATITPATEVHTERGWSDSAIATTVEIALGRVVERVHPRTSGLYCRLTIEGGQILTVFDGRPITDARWV